MGVGNNSNKTINQSVELKPTYSKSSYCDEVWLNRNDESASDYMRSIAENGTYANNNSYYVPLPHKLYRCLGLTIYEKMILTELIAYMGTNCYCFPTQETIALNIGATSKTVSEHLWRLHDKGFVIVDYRKHNNVYYLSVNLQDNPYVVLSELTHEFIREKRNFGMVNEKTLLSSIKQFVDGVEYGEFANEIQQAYMRSTKVDVHSSELKKVKEIVMRFRGHLETLV